MTDIDALRKVAEEATPGPWRSIPDDDHSTTETVYGDHALAWLVEPQDAAYIAAANPTAILDLLDRLTAAEAAVARCRALADEWERQDRTIGGILSHSHHGLYADRVRAALDGVVKERHHDRDR